MTPDRLNHPVRREIFPDRAPLDHIEIAPDRPEPASGGPLFLSLERVLIGALLCAAALGLWLGWPS